MAQLAPSSSSHPLHVVSVPYQMLLGHRSYHQWIGWAARGGASVLGPQSPLSWNAQDMLRVVKLARPQQGDARGDMPLSTEKQFKGRSFLMMGAGLFPTHREIILCWMPNRAHQASSLKKKKWRVQINYTYAHQENFGHSYKSANIHEDGGQTKPHRTQRHSKTVDHHSIRVWWS